MLNIYKVEFCIGTLLSLEKELNVPLDSLLFELEVTPEIQKAIFYHGIKRSTKLGRKKIYEIYDNLSKTDRLRVDMKVNGRLLDSFGVGKQRERNEDVPQETEVKFFSEYMTKFMFYMMGAVGMSFMQIFLQKNTFFLRKNAYSTISPFKVAADALFIRTFINSPI